MLCFPQLDSGAIAQYPFRRRRVKRVVTTRSAGGEVRAWQDPGVDLVEWTLHLNHLTTSEWRRIEDLFVSARGRQRDFLFLDPMANLLSSTEDLTESMWNHSPMLVLQPRELGFQQGTRSTSVVNTGQVAGEVYQEVPAAGGLTLVLSVYLRAESPLKVDLFARQDGIETTSEQQVGETWRRHSVSFTTMEPSVASCVGIRVPEGTSIDVGGPQLEAQPAPSAYQASAKGGAYTSTRFADDSLTCVAVGPSLLSTTIQLISRSH